MKAASYAVKMFGLNYNQIDELISEAILIIVFTAGDLEKNFDGSELTRMIYLRTRLLLISYIKKHMESFNHYSINSFYKNSLNNKIGKSELVVPDKNEDTASIAIRNIDDESIFELHTPIITRLNYYISNGYNEEYAIKLVSKDLDISTEKLLELAKEELIQNNKIKEISNGKIILRKN